jgi:hypothetical protein
MVQNSGPGRTHGLQRTGQRRGCPGRGVVRAWRIDGKECYDDCDGYMVGVHKSTTGWWFQTWFIFPNSWDDDPI